MIIPDIRFIPTKNRGAKITPSIIVIHYTAGGNAEGAISTFLNAGVSAHFVIGRDGAVTQMVDTDVAAWHAGVSSWKGRRELNQWSIGIELVNWGPLTKNDNKEYISWAKTVIPENEIFRGKHKNPKCKYEYWQSYTEKQISALCRITSILHKHYGILEVVGHEDVSPERKIDPGPAFLFWDCIRGKEKSDDRTTVDGVAGT